MDFVRVMSAQVLGHYRLRIGFSDGSSRDVDLTGELHGPVFEPLADPDFFAQVRVDDELGLAEPRDHSARTPSIRLHLMYNLHHEGA